MHKNLQALKFEIANRDKNGLMDAGAIIEKRTGTNKRHSILIDRDAYFAGLKS